ncbi:MAG TPA: S8 family serine peptidase [Pyrinomonadaceae bacterium]|jgi:subtilisin family serine protease|nr:S8 family serine peptidase [Pyrinomonadaceae bacterium]
MNRQNFLGHLALALALIALAALAGQVRRWQHASYDAHVVEQQQPSTAVLTPRDTASAAEVQVRFRPGTSVDMMRNIARRFDDRVEDEIEAVDGLAFIADEDGKSAEEVAAEYRSLAGLVEYAEPVGRINLDQMEINHEHPDDPMFNEQWSLDNHGQNGGKTQADISAVRAWAKTTGSSKVVVAVIDSGVDYTHQDLMNNIWVRPPDIDEYTDDELGTIDDTYGFNAVNDNGDPMDQNGHGTHCAGIIGAEGGNALGIAGVNWKVEIMPLRFIDANGSGTTKDAIKAINYVIDRKRAGVNVRIISASWGSTMYSKALEDVIREAGKEGILFIAASGNSSADADKSPHYPASYDLPNVISVAALTRQDQLAGFSNYGAKSVHIAAPGAEILSTWLGGEFREASGTSMATPEVAGVAALVLSVDPDLSMKELRARLLESVDKLDALSGKVSSGGRINAARAVGAD